MSEKIVQLNENVYKIAAKERLTIFSGEKKGAAAASCAESGLWCFLQRRGCRTPVCNNLVRQRRKFFPRFGAVFIVNRHKIESGLLCVFRRAGHGEVPVRDEGADGGGVEQLLIVGVGLDEAALDAAFKNGGENQAHGHREVARQQPYPVDAFDVRPAVHEHQHEGHHRQPQIAAALEDAAFGEDQHQRRGGAQHHPRQHHIAAGAVAVVIVRQHAVRKEKDQLVEVVGQHQKEQQYGGQVQKVRPLRQAVVLRLSKGQRHQHRQHGDEQHGQVAAVPQEALCGYIAGVVFHRAQREPQQH